MSFVWTKAAILYLTQWINNRIPVCWWRYLFIFSGTETLWSYLFQFHAFLAIVFYIFRHWDPMDVYLSVLCFSTHCILYFQVRRRYGLTCFCSMPSQPLCRWLALSSYLIPHDTWCWRQGIVLVLRKVSIHSVSFTLMSDFSEMVSPRSLTDKFYQEPT